MSRRIYISGASGAGVSTLGAGLAAKLQVPHFDVDNYYWYPTEPPFEQSRPPAERVNLLNQSLTDGQWILSGSLDGWGDEVIQGADLVVFIDTPTSLRIERLKARESLRYGERILPGGICMRTTWRSSHGQKVTKGALKLVATDYGTNGGSSSWRYPLLG
jgi:adenylate kinase family enzyme